MESGNKLFGEQFTIGRRCHHNTRIKDARQADQPEQVASARPVIICTAADIVFSVGHSSLNVFPNPVQNINDSSLYQLPTTSSPAAILMIFARVN
jgi:hypothetical protein